MEFKQIKKNFKVVGMKNSGVFDDYGTEVPKFAQQFLRRANEIKNSSETEIALYEPKRNDNHLEGQYYVGLIVNETLNEVPTGMEYIETTQDYVNMRGKISDIGKLHKELLKWADEQGFQRDLESYIVETYHQNENSEEEVEIYLPILL